jgi:hypothetical protein
MPTEKTRRGKAAAAAAVEITSAGGGRWERARRAYLCGWEVGPGLGLG